MKKLIFSVLISMLFGMSLSAQTVPGDTSKPWFKISDTTSFKGKYKMEGVGFDYMGITVKDSSLFFEGGEYAGSLTPLKDKKDAFDAMGIAVFTFSRNPVGEVEILKIDYNGALYEGKKEKPAAGTQ